MAEDQMQVDNDSPSFSDALDKIYNARKDGWSSLEKCVLRLPCVKGLVDVNGRLGGVNVDQLFSLSFLSVFLGESDAFLPQQLFLRQEMQDMFATLITPHEGKVLRRILTGSPGIGKSVVFFLAAVQRAATHDKRVFYLRKAQEQEAYISVFIMEKSPGGTGISVDVVFSQDLPVKRNSDLAILNNTIVDASQLGDKDFYIMLDGPKHNDPPPDLLYSGYHALCTSGGFPAPSQAAFPTVEILVLSGWTEEKLKEAMQTIGIQETDKKYELTGGRIRLVFWSDKEIKVWFTTILDDFGPAAIKLAVTSNAATGCTESSDRLRTRFFQAQDEKIQSEMIVDSRYAFSLLRGKLNGQDILEAYNLAKVLGLQAARGWFYEEILHRRFRELKRENHPLIKGWDHQGDTTGAEGVASFVESCKQKTGTYWAPPIPNFANIDAAVLQESFVLVCFQYTVQETHHFDKASFWTDFVNHLVVEQVHIKGVRVVFVTPSDVSFNVASHENYFQDVSIGEGVQTRMSPLQQIPVTFSYVSLDAASSADDVAEKLLANTV